MNMSALFACSRCFSRHPFEELSSGQQLCKECRGAFPVVKCTYCRSEFQQTNKGSPSAICKKCETNVKQFGKPSACEYCNIIAAFIGNKCQRCTNSEKKYGPPVTCEQCKQKCAFDRKDEDKKVKLQDSIYSVQVCCETALNCSTVDFPDSSYNLQCNCKEPYYDVFVDGKLLCWLCTLSYKRALAKTKQSDADRRAHIKLAAQRAAKNKEHGKHKGHNKRPHRVDVTKLNQPSSDKDGGEGGPPAKAARGGSGAGNNRGDPHDPNSSDHVVAMTQLKEQIASLQKQLNQKDSQLLSKDKMITELKAKHFTVENELRNKMKNMQKEYETKVETFSIKIKSLQKEVATLSKSGKKQLSVAARELGGGSGGAGSGSGTDSPSLA